MSTTGQTATTPLTAARAAAEWWAEQIGSPTFRLTDRPDPAAGFTEALATIAAAKHPVSTGAGRRFADELENRIEDLMRNSHRSSWASVLTVDYGPCDTLAEAAAAAGVSTTRFPIKTRMWIDDDTVRASLGYGSRTVLIWSRPGWVHPPCGQHRYPNGPSGTPVDVVCSLPRWHDGECGGWRADTERCGACGGGWSAHHDYSIDDSCENWYRVPRVGGAA